MAAQYLTIHQNTEFELVIKKSRFICSLARVHSEQEAQDFITRISKENRKANHNCYAYLRGDNDQIQRESDNGEPSGTAGVPILEALQLAHVHDVCAVVTRYFGGIKLGAGGLIRAYSNVTTEAIAQAGLVERITQQVVAITVPYRLNDQVHYYLEQAGLALAGEEYGVDVTIRVFINLEEVDEQIQTLTDRFNHQLQIKKEDQRFHEVPLNN